MVRHIAKNLQDDKKEKVLDDKGDVVLDALAKLPDFTIEILEHDPRTERMMTRWKILQEFSVRTPVKTDLEAGQMHKRLYDAMEKDDYLAEAVSVGGQEVCATLGRIAYIRDVLLRLQTSCDKVDALVDSHKDMINTVNTVSKSLMVEVQQALSAAMAKEKAASEEEKAKKLEKARMEKERAKEQKKAEQKRKREEEKDAKKRKQEADKAAKEAAAAAGANLDTPPQEPDADGQGKTRSSTRRARIGAVTELTETDPVILRDKQLPLQCHLTDFTVTCQDFFREIIRRPEQVQLIKDKGVLRKMFASYPGISKETVNSYAKKLTAETQLIVRTLSIFFKYLIRDLVRHGTEVLTGTSTAATTTIINNTTLLTVLTD